jgi:YesN/AraC family two-component response regulator
MVTDSHLQHSVLIVEDDGILRLGLQVLFEAQNFKVYEAENAADAFELLLSKTDIEMVVTDIQMPGEVDGVELLHAVHKRWPHILLLVTSGQIIPSDFDLPKNAHFLQKPLSEFELLKSVQNLLRGEAPA